IQRTVPKRIYNSSIATIQPRRVTRIQPRLNIHTACDDIIIAPMPEDENRKRVDNDTPEPDSAKTIAKDTVGPRYGSLIEYPKDPEQGAETPASSDDKENADSSASSAVQDDADKDDDVADSASSMASAVQDAMDSIDRKLEATAPAAGVYLLRDRAGKVLYVGKAKNLRSRVRAYFREGGDGPFQVRFLMRRVSDFDTIVTASEKEALILENNLIKQYKPKYNIRLKDDKSYLSAKITNHAWPRITVTRKIVKDCGHYFGPFGSACGLRDTIDVIRTTFPLRTCTDAVFRNRSRPCLEYQINRSLRPSVLPADPAQYG